MGRTLAAAAAHNGYGDPPEGVHVISPAASLLEVLRRSECRVLSTQSLREIGVYHRGEDYWLVLAGVVETPAAAPCGTAALRPAAPPPAAAAVSRHRCRPRVRSSSSTRPAPAARAAGDTSSHRRLR